MVDPFERLRLRLARDDAVSEVVAYVMMFGMGAVALTFSMEIMTDAQQRGTEVATGRQMKQVAQVSSTLIEEAARAAHTAPNATFETTFELPSTIGGQNYTIQLFVPNKPGTVSWSPPCPTNPKLRVVTADEQLNTEVLLSNRTTGELTEGQCLQLDTDSTVHSSDPHLQVKYEWGTDHPEIKIESVNR